MITRSAKKLTEILVKEEIVPYKSREIYEYGMELIISTVLNLVLVLFIGALFHAVGEGVCYFLILATIRTQSGGYHANSYLRCSALYCLLFLITIALSEIADYFAINPVLPILCLLINTCYIWRCAPVLHLKELDHEEKKHAKRKATLRCLIWTIASVALGAVDKQLLYAVTVTISIVSILMEVEKKRRE